LSKTRNTRKKTTEARVQVIRPSSREARDEGPRLIPLGRLPEEPRVQRYLELADAALKQRKKSKSKKSGAGRRP
jgi:hypothetical protein